VGPRQAQQEEEHLWALGAADDGAQDGKLGAGAADGAIGNGDVLSIDMYYYEQHSFKYERKGLQPA
jgi:hypothetical protein